MCLESWHFYTFFNFKTLEAWEKLLTEETLLSTLYADTVVVDRVAWFEWPERRLFHVGSWHLTTCPTVAPGVCSWGTLWGCSVVPRLTWIPWQVKCHGNLYLQEYPFLFSLDSGSNRASVKQQTLTQENRASTSSWFLRIPHWYDRPRDQAWKVRSSDVRFPTCTKQGCTVDELRIIDVNIRTHAIAPRDVWLIIIYSCRHECIYLHCMPAIASMCLQTDRCRNYSAFVRLTGRRSNRHRHSNTVRCEYRPKITLFCVTLLLYTLCPGNVPAIMHCYAPHCNMPPPCTVVHAIFPMLSVASCSHLGLLRKGKERVTLSALVSDCNVPDFFALSPGRCDDAWVFQWKMKKCVKNLTIQSDDI